MASRAATRAAAAKAAENKARVDAINAEQADESKQTETAASVATDKEKPVAKAKTDTQDKEQKPARVLTARQQAVRDAKERLGGKRPERSERTKLSNDELVAYVTKVRKAHPDSTLMVELRYAQFVEGLAFSDERFKAAWDEAEKSASAPRKSAGRSRKAA